jgi:hypothetical protein
VIAESIRAARHAGIQQATRPTAVMIPATPIRVVGSYGPFAAHTYRLLEAHVPSDHEPVKGSEVLPVRKEGVHAKR